MKKRRANDSVGVNLQDPSQTDSGALRREKFSSLDAIFEPRSVAVIGATDREGSVGRATLVNLNNASFQGRIYPVNPHHRQILGLRSYAAVREIPNSLDLAVVLTPAATVPGVVGECIDAGVKAADVISAGFKEQGADGQALEAEIADQLSTGECG